MPRKELDYSKTVFYKIVCNDLNIPDCYIGHTTNFTNRKYQHKNTCNNISQKDYNTFVYKFIRENGGWNNFSMIMIEEKSCESKLDAERYERKLIEELKASLNQVIPSRSKEEYDEHRKVSGKHQEYEKSQARKDTYKKYRETHSEQIREAMKKYQDSHKEELKAYQKQTRTVKCVCELCGFEGLKTHIRRHQQTDKCKQSAKLKQNITE